MLYKSQNLSSLSIISQSLAAVMLIYIHPLIMYCSHKKLHLDMQTIKSTKKLLKYTSTDIQNNKMIKQVGVGDNE